MRRTSHGRWFGWQLVLLLLQFLAGMAVNLWVSLPSNHPGAHAPAYFAGLARGIPWAFSEGPSLLRVHALVSLLVGAMAVVLVVRTLRGRGNAPVGPALLGLFFVIGAAFNGGSFLNYGANISSFIMSLTFALASVCYVLGWGSCLLRDHGRV